MLFLFICLPGWPCSISIHLSSRSVTATVRPFRRPCSISIHCLSLLVSGLFRWRCNISIHLFPDLSLLVSALFPWACSMSIHLFRGVCHWCCRPFPLAMQHFYSFVFHVISFFLSFRFGACAAVFCCWNRFACERFLLLCRSA